MLPGIDTVHAHAVTMGCIECNLNMQPCIDFYISVQCAFIKKILTRVHQLASRHLVANNHTSNLYCSYQQHVNRCQRRTLSFCIVYISFYCLDYFVGAPKWCVSVRVHVCVRVVSVMCCVQNVNMKNVNGTNPLDRKRKRMKTKGIPVSKYEILWSIP